MATNVSSYDMQLRLMNRTRNQDNEAKIESLRKAWVPSRIAEAMYKDKKTQEEKCCIHCWASNFDWKWICLYCKISRYE